MCSLCCLCTAPATPISNRPPAMCGQHEPPVRPAAPRFESRRCDLCQSWGEDEPDSLRYLKVANRSGSEVEGSPARAGAQRSEREKGGDFVPGDSKGRSPWRAFGDFLRDGKVTRGGGAERPPGGCRGYQPRTNSRSLRPLYKKRIPDACQQIAGRRRHKGAAGRAVPALLLPAGADGLGRLLDRVDHRLLLHPALL